MARIGTLRFKHHPARGSTVDVVLFTADGTRIVSLSQDYADIRLWDAASGKEIPGPWTAANKRYCAVAFSPDGTRLAALSNPGFVGPGQTPRGEIILYEIASAQAVKTISGVKHQARALAFADDGRTLVSAGEGTVCWWDVDSGKEKRTWMPFPEEKPAKEDSKVKTFVNCALAPNGESIVVEVAWRFSENALNGAESANETAQQVIGYKLASEKMTFISATTRSPYLRYFQVGSGYVVTGQTSRLAFSADGKRVAFPATRDLIEVRNPITGKLVVTPLEVKSSGGNIVGLTLSNDGSQLAVAGTDGNIILSDINSAAGQPTSAPRKIATRIAQNPPSKRALHFSRDNKRLVVGADADIQLYDVASLKEVHPWEGHRGWIDYVLFTPDDKRLLTGSARTSLYPQELASWDTATWKRVQLTSLLAPPWPNVGIVAPDQSVYASKNGAELFELATGKLLTRLNLPKGQPAQGRGSFSPSGKHYLLAGQPNNQKSLERLYALPSGKLLCQLPAAATSPYSGVSVRQVAFSSDDGLIAIFGQDRMIHLCETSTGRERHRLETGVTDQGPGGGRYFVANMAFSPDNKYLASWAVNLYDYDADPRRKPIRVWDVATGKELLQVVPDTSKSPRGSIYDRLVQFAWSPDGRVLAVGQNKIRLCEIATLGVRRELPGHADATVQALAFSHDGRLLASGSTDTTVLVWDTSLSGSGPPLAGAPARADVEKRWQALAEDDAPKAYTAIRELAALPRETVEWIKDRLKPAERLDPKHVDELIGQLGHDQFKIRQKANAELLQIGERLVPALDAALAGNPPLETSLRLQDLRKRLTSLLIKGQRLQAFRAVEVLENIATPEAREALRGLADGAPGALVTVQARSALERLAR
jgi:WD40 repeat protein